MYLVRHSGCRWPGSRPRRPRSATPATPASRLIPGRLLGALLLGALAAPWGTACALESAEPPEKIPLSSTAGGGASEREKGDLADLDRQDGLLGLKFGTKLSAVKREMNLIARHGKWQFHSRPREKLKLGETELMAVHYGFYRGRLASISVYTNGEENAKKLLAWLEVSFGEGERGKRESRYWVGESVRAVYEKNPASRATILSLTSRKLVEIKEQK